MMTQKQVPEEIKIQQGFEQRGKTNDELVGNNFQQTQQAVEEEEC